MEKHSFFCVLLASLILSITGCQATSKYIGSSFEPTSSMQSSNTISSAQSQKADKVSSTESDSKKVSSSPRPTSSTSVVSSNTSNISSSSEEYVKEYVEKRQVATKKVADMSKNEVMKFVEKTINASYSDIQLPKSLIFTKGTVECIFEQINLFSPQNIEFSFEGELDLEEEQEFLSYFNQKHIYKYDDSDYSENTYYKYHSDRFSEFFATEKNIVVIEHFWGLKNTFNASLGTTILYILTYDKENGKRGFHLEARCNNYEYLIGNLQIQPDGSAKAIG